MKKVNVRMIAMCGMLIALYFVLGRLGYMLDFQAVKVSFEGLPVLIGGLLFGPGAGIAIGGIGSFLTQVLGPYGLTVTTPIWMAPYIVSGLFAGVFALVKKYNFKLRDYWIGIAIYQVIITAINTLGLYVASHIEGWYHPTLITGNLLVRLVIMVVIIVVYGLIVPPLLKVIKKIDRVNE